MKLLQCISSVFHLAGFSVADLVSLAVSELSELPYLFPLCVINAVTKRTVLIVRR